MRLYHHAISVPPCGLLHSLLCPSPMRNPLALVCCQCHQRTPTTDICLASPDLGLRSNWQVIPLCESNATEVPGVKVFNNKTFKVTCATFLQHEPGVPNHTEGEGAIDLPSRLGCVHNPCTWQCQVKPYYQWPHCPQWSTLGDGSRTCQYTVTAQSSLDKKLWSPHRQGVDHTRLWFHSEPHCRGCLRPVELWPYTIYQTHAGKCTNLRIGLC